MITGRVFLTKLPMRGIKSWITEIDGIIHHVPLGLVNYIHKLELYMDIDIEFLQKKVYSFHDDTDFLKEYDIPVSELFKPFIKEKKQYSVVKGSHVQVKKKDFGLSCCYCECILTGENYTREHVIPRRVGGKIIKPCCRDCNQEKGGLMLKSYIQLLNLKLMESSGYSLRILQTKIKNANLLAIEIKNRTKIQ